ncbi:TldD/PmbA family protein [Chitinimonas lacunae]|uniref:TldD/PmbA family protein n=1 Tax=Chitinimonas lacunae TaxID=1963018 RepID=A0ABV8MQ54_9NEIS
MDQQAFYRLADHLHSLLRGDEAFTAWLAAEDTDFIRFNHGRVRQAGSVSQAYLDLQWLRGARHISETVALSGTAADLERVSRLVGELRSLLDQVPDDPYLLLNTEPHNSQHLAVSRLPSAESMVDDIVSAAAGDDLVGVLAAGPMRYGFANSWGQRNWHESASWNFDWSLYAHGDKAVKRGGAGFEWDASLLKTSLARAREELALLRRPVKPLSPGRYRAFMTPSALSELVQMFNWAGFSEKEIRAKRSAMLRLTTGEATLSPRCHLYEDTAGGLGPAFQRQGFIKPARVDLVQNGRFASSLVSPRSARQYGVASNGAGAEEGAESLALGPGDLPMAKALAALDTGLYISNLWYLNYSDRGAARVTGMTRFACFWVENGQIVAPLDVMRFDDSLYRLLGDQLEALTCETELLADPNSYGARLSHSIRVPGALLSGLQLVS